MNPLANAEAADSRWKSLYKASGASALIAIVFAIIQIIIEIIGVSATGLAVPSTVIGWFTLLQNNRLLGLTELTVFQIPVFALLIPMFLALYAALKRTSEGFMAIATILAIVGITVYLASNTALSMLSLSDQYAAATTDAQRSMFLAAGQAMLAIYEGVGINVGVFLVLVAILIISAVMLRSNIFSKVTAYMGILASVIGLAYYIIITMPAIGIFFLLAASPFFLIWIILIALRLFRLGRGLLKVDGQ